MNAKGSNSAQHDSHPNRDDFEVRNRRSEDSFTSTGGKILHHPDAVNALRQKRNWPIVLHIMPTEVCNLRCVFCSVANRGEKGSLFPDLTMEQIEHVISALKQMGLKAVILSGGGEPTLYPHINRLVEYLVGNGLQVGMITNGILLGKKLSVSSIQALTWVRISINTLDYLQDLQVPTLAPGTTLGFSYIVNTLTSKEVLLRIRQKVAEVSQTFPVAYVRLLPDCNLETSELEKAHAHLRTLAKEMGAPFFHQYKIHERPAECHLGRVHPVLYTDGYIYPCDSLVLNSPPDDRKFHSDFALCRWDEVAAFYSTKIKGSLVDTRKCPNCVFARQNKLLMQIIENVSVPLPTHGPADLAHVNFI